MLALLNFSDKPLKVGLPLKGHTWRRRLDSSGTPWGGPGSTVPDTVRNTQAVCLNPHSAVVLEKTTVSGA
jgi:hypothetical protein